MANAEAAGPAKKKMPQGGRKGGTIFPRLSLKQALAYSKKLVAKTHTGPQPEETLLPGVFGASGGRGKIKASALKQFGLLKGAPDGYEATQLAKDIDAAPDEERSPLLQTAFRTSKLFSQIFAIFHGDTVSRAKIEQQAKKLDVHPDTAAQCTTLFMESAATAGLGTATGDLIALINAADAAAEPPQTEAPDQENEPEEVEAAEQGQPASPPVPAELVVPLEVPNGEGGNGGRRSNKTDVTVTLNVDSSSDPDKLEKQLKLLRQYGVI